MRPGMRWRTGLLLLLAVVGMWPAAVVRGQGIIIEPGPVVAPRPPVGGPIQIDLHQIDAVIDGPIATVQVKQVFRNETNQTVEGTYVFPLPVDAAISDFQMTVDGQTLEGQLYSREEARSIYEAIVRQQRDPALLEYLGQGLFQTSVFPIPPGATRTIELRYSQVLDQRDGLYQFHYPLRTQQFGSAPVGTLSLRAELRNQPGLRTIYSPSHELDIERDGSDQAVAGFEQNGGQPATDFDLFFGVSDAAVGLNLLSYKPAGEDGFFLLLAAPDVEVDEDAVVQRDLVLVLDVSGSMEGEKMRQAQDAAHYLVDHLNPGDRFNLIAFSTGARLWQAELQDVSDEARADAHGWIDDLEAVGSTDINRALLEALAQLSDEAGGNSRPEYLLFMTDGLPTQGETDPRQIMENVENNLTPDSSLRLFSFGVGYDVNTDLLNSLSRDLGGRSAYVRPEENIREAVSAFYEGIATPVLANVAVDLGEGVVVDEVYPYPLPDLFAGEQLVVAGRYHEGGDVTVTLEGDVNGAPVRYQYPERELVEAGGEPFVARLWATRKLGALLEQVRLDGPNEELIDAIVQLSLEYGIVTPYTSYLVLEPNMVVEGGAEILPDVIVDAFDAAPAPVLPSARDAVAAGAAEAAAAPASGEEAVVASDERGRLQSATTVGETNEVRYAGGRAFVQQGWVAAADGTQYPFWVDTQYNDPVALTTVTFGSDEYFALAEDPALAEMLALSPEMVIVQPDGSGLRITTVGSDDQGEPAATPAPTEARPQPDAAQPDTWQEFLEWLFGSGGGN